MRAVTFGEGDPSTRPSGLLRMTGKRGQDDRETEDDRNIKIFLGKEMDV